MAVLLAALSFFVDCSRDVARSNIPHLLLTFQYLIIAPIRHFYALILVYGVLLLFSLFYCLGLMVGNRITSLME